MSIGFFIVGFVIFSVYIYFTLWNIYYSGKKQAEENYPNLNKKNVSQNKETKKDIESDGL